MSMEKLEKSVSDIAKGVVDLNTKVVVHTALTKEGFKQTHYRQDEANHRTAKNEDLAQNLEKRMILTESILKTLNNSSKAMADGWRKFAFSILQVAITGMASGVVAYAVVIYQGQEQSQEIQEAITFINSWEVID